VERGGVRIGIIGAIGDVLSSISGEFSNGLNFAVRGELTEMVKAEAARLRQQEGCHFIVYSLHAGGETTTYQPQDHLGSMGYYNMELSEGYVDLVFEGHSHRAYILRDKRGVYHLQGGGYNAGISFANVCYNLVTNTYEVQDLQILQDDTFADSSLADDPIVDQLYSQYFAEEDPYTTILGSNDVLRSSNDIGHIVAQLYLEKGREVWGQQYDVVLGGGFVKTRTPYDLAPGDVTYSQLFSLLPFDNSLVLCKVTGKQLREKFLNSGSYFIAHEDGLRQSVDDNAFYYVVTDTYTSFYKHNMFEEVARLENYYARDLLKDYIAAGNWGGQAQLITIAQANAIGEALGENESTPQAYQLTGVVTAVENTTYGNLYIADEAGNTFYLYGLYDSTGRIRYDGMDAPPQVGDTITVIGAITKYVGYHGTILEIQSARLQ
jgi:2',3'-cyclic-nucleotide 2'-phosphodiesterase (5'-nucleotidase family)